MEKKQYLSWFTRQRIQWGGGLPEILENHPTEIQKYVMFGTIVLLTALLASVSGGYAIYSISGNLFVPFLFGPFWGFIIFNLDRAILISMRKPYIPSRAETLLWTEKDINEERRIMRLRALRKEMLRKNWSMFAIRLAIALVIGFTISIPIETLIFNNRIHDVWIENKEKETALVTRESLQQFGTLNGERERVNRLAQEKQEKLYRDPELTEQKNTKQEQTTAIAELKQKIARQTQILRANYFRSVDDLGRVHYKPNEQGRQAQLLRKQYEGQLTQAKRDLQTTNQQIMAITTRLAEESLNIRDQARHEENSLDSLQRKTRKEKAGFETYRNEFDRLDLIEQIELLHTLRDNPSVRWTSILVTLLFLLIEIAPVTVKFLTPRGLYDEVLEYQEQEQLNRSKYNLHKSTSELNSRLQVDAENAKLYIAAKTDLYEKSLKDMSAEWLQQFQEMLWKRQNGPAAPTINNHSQTKSSLNHE
ncbi:DUF4407 domain-containing protein [Larkinella sp. GY13]|uniref:DUF4407 domain-containing protein n=1 Tax=Larkinella sp. GY13 TaxID=3453720 RepID=UPI003EEF9DFF